jgi:hypothetical protein
LILNHKKNVNVIHSYVGVSFNLHKDSRNYYIYILFLPFHGLENNLKGQHLSWKNAYFNVKNDVVKIRKTFVYNFNILNDYGDEWDNL